MEIKKLPTLPTLMKKKQVAAYARVSSGKDAMLHSLSAQVSYYSAYIQKRPKWLYSGTTPLNEKIRFTEFPYLRPGDNQISWGGTGTVRSVYIAPNWRTL